MIDEKTLGELNQKLGEEKRRLEEELSKLANKESGGDYEAKFEDMGRSEEDNAEEVEEYATKVSITETLEKNLKDTTDALEKIENGTYGKCENCSGEIRLERLQVYPAARICMKCSETK
jgi:RNA polymerase-binding transcription factor DksA